MKQTFPTKKNLFLGIFIWGILLGSLAMMIYYLLQAFNITAFVVILVVWVPIVPILGAVWFRTRYIINNELLVIKIGPYTEREIDINEIISLKRSNSLLASPANSFKRLEVKYRGGMILLSPVREDEFLSLLTKLNPEIKTDLKSS